MKKLNTFIAFVSAFILLNINAEMIASQSLPDSILFKGTQIDIGETFRTGYFTNFGHVTVNSFFEDTSGVLHLAYVDNYKLYYYKSTNDGDSWTKEQITTGHEGDIHNCALTVDNDGNVFIAITVHDFYNYSYPTAVYSGGEFYYDAYCTNNKSGSWITELVATHDAASNYGPKPMALFSDSNNDIHLIANYYGWLSRGGTAWEWIRNSLTDTWSDIITIAEFTDTDFDKFISESFVLLRDKQDHTTLVLSRTKGTNNELFYVSNLGSGWETPVTIFPNIAVASNRFDAVIDSAGHTYTGYLAESIPGKPELKISKDFEAAVTSNINLAATDTLNYFKLHCNSKNKFTMYLWIKNKNASICFSDDAVNWTDPIEISNNEKKYVGGILAKTDTRTGYFSDYAKQILAGGPRTAQPYGPDTLYFGSIEVQSATSVEDTKDIPYEFVLHQNYPNPFNPGTKISWQSPVSGWQTLKVYDVLGNEIATLVNEEKPAGNYETYFNPATSIKNPASGIYFYQLKIGSFIQAKKMILIK